VATPGILGVPINMKPPTPLAERFWKKVEITESCWIWHGHRGKFGHGSIRTGGVGFPKEAAHRVAYKLLVGPIPEGLVLDHLCRHGWCVNPAHLEPVTNAENLLRGETGPGINSRKTQCKNGHPFDEANTYRLPSDPSFRRCRTCKNAKLREWYHKHKIRVSD